jgi:hypothetical protein
MFVIAEYYPGTNHLYYAENFRVGKCVSIKTVPKIEFAQKFKTKEEIQSRLIAKGFKPFFERPIRGDMFIMEL